jgi:hypothetical protein
MNQAANSIYKESFLPASCWLLVCTFNALQGTVSHQIELVIGCSRFISAEALPNQDYTVYCGISSVHPNNIRCNFFAVIKSQER